ncbi:hypothetical protein [Paenibacillus sp. LK1]|uniref:hypothetical protein n=1 Tax=Paenibacillus sp. LK1 TaxID=2053014 RepID=UPI000C177553|nr:hypothetical protein [Paenibacillus sp. LK1]PIH59128.1 hypothetical protein CS562_14410 [Paenibacillus sp. LK1]
MSEVVARCIKEISRVMPPIRGMHKELAEQMKKEYKVEVNDIVHVDVSENIYFFYLNHEKVNMDYTELKDHFVIVWERGCYNTCIREGQACKKIGHFIPHDTTNRDRAASNCCQLGWEIGRAECRMFE